MIIAILLLSGSAHGEEALPKYCEPPRYTVRGRSMDMEKQVFNPNLFTKDELNDPEAGRKLASTPGPYGHSELGFRYLARLFGYPGEKFQKEDVELWLVKEESLNYSTKRGMADIWREWVVDAKKRLPVPYGAVSAIPARAGPSLFFKGPEDQANHARCVGDALDKKFCENYLGGVIWSEDDRVSFGRPGSHRVCAYNIGDTNRLRQQKEKNWLSRDPDFPNQPARNADQGGATGVGGSVMTGK